MKGVVEIRKHYAGYLKGLHGNAKLRNELMTYVDSHKIIDTLELYKENYYSKNLVET